MSFAEVDFLTGRKTLASGFTDAQYMTAKEKEMVAKAFERFLKNNFREEDFTKRLYEHLHLHCGFIAHYDINGFYGTYFEDPANTISFLDRLLGHPYTMGDYKDVEAAFLQSFNKHKETIRRHLSSRLLEVADQEMQQAQKLYEMRRALSEKTLDGLP